MDPELESLLAVFPELKLQTGKGTVLCSLSRHEMPGRVEVVKSYVEGRKFQKLKSENDFNFQRLEPYIVPSRARRRRGRQLFCALTNRYLNRIPAEVKLHLKGKRYKCAMEKYNAGQLSLFEERLGRKAEREMAEKKDAEADQEIEEEDKEEEGEDEEEDGENEGVEMSEELPVKKSSRVVVGRKRRAAAIPATTTKCLPQKINRTNHPMSS